MSKIGVIKQVAKDYLNIDSLKAVNATATDYHEVTLATVRAALEAAYEAGKNAK